MGTTTDPLEPYYFQEEPEVICGRPVKPITDDFVANYPSMVDRFYTRYYYIKRSKQGTEPYVVLFHSNRICLICLAREHPAVSAGIETINFDIGNLDRSKNVVKGKGKKGGMVLSPETTLAVLTDRTGRSYKIPACLRGKLVEINSAIIEDPKRLANPSMGEGYVAIVQFSLGICDLVKSSLLTQQDYDKELRTEMAVGKDETSQNEAPSEETGVVAAS